MPSRYSRKSIRWRPYEKALADETVTRADPNSARNA
jgi:hypothetical protein